MHEESLYDDGLCWFATFTYDDEHLVYGRCQLPTLVPQHIVKLFKDIRKRIGKVRFFLVGEYGDKFRRPHYHAILFGISLHDVVKVSYRNGNDLFKSHLLTTVWGRGEVILGKVTPESVAYTARYCVKKCFGLTLEDYLERDIIPEFTRMSRNPGIGYDWFKLYRSDIESVDAVNVGGFRSKPPRYYDKLSSKYRFPLARSIESIKDARMESARKFLSDSTPERLAVREAVAHGRLGSLPSPVF